MRVIWRRGAGEERRTNAVRNYQAFLSGDHVDLVDVGLTIRSQLLSRRSAVRRTAAMKFFSLACLRYKSRSAEGKTLNTNVRWRLLRRRGQGGETSTVYQSGPGKISARGRIAGFFCPTEFLKDRDGYFFTIWKEPRSLCE